MYMQYIRTTGSSSEREILMCLRGNNNRTNTGKIRRPERESNPRGVEFFQYLFCYYFLLDTSEFLSLTMNQLFEMYPMYITLIRDLHQVWWASCFMINRIPSPRGLGANAWKSVFVISPSHCSCLGSSVVEHQPWNRWVVGSIPAQGIWVLVLDTRSVGTTIAVGHNMQICHSLSRKQNR